MFACIYGVPVEVGAPLSCFLCVKQVTESCLMSSFQAHQIHLQLCSLLHGLCSPYFRLMGYEFGVLFRHWELLIEGGICHVRSCFMFVVHVYHVNVTFASQLFLVSYSHWFIILINFKCLV